VTATPSAFKQAQPELERRQEARCAVKWKAAIVWTEGNDRYWEDVRTTDLSLSGASVYCEHNLQLPPSCTLMLSMPALSAESKPEMVKIECRYVYGAYHAKVGLFRIGLTFSRFEDGGREALRQRLEQYPSF
jgi:c-di-GMP-binding flagellar brake protein YcgR